MLKVKNIVWTLFFCLFLHYFHFSLYFCKCYLPIVARMLTEVCRAAGVERYILKGVIALCFWSFKTSTIEQQTKTMKGWLPRGVYIRLRSVLRGYLYPHRHTLRCIYILHAWMFLCLFTVRAVVGYESRTGRCKHPRFSFVVINRVK